MQEPIPFGGPFTKKTDGDGHRPRSESAHARRRPSFRLTGGRCRRMARRPGGAAPVPRSQLRSGAVSGRTDVLRRPAGRPHLDAPGPDRRRSLVRERLAGSRSPSVLPDTARDDPKASRDVGLFRNLRARGFRWVLLPMSPVRTDILLDSFSESIETMFQSTRTTRA